MNISISYLYLKEELDPGASRVKMLEKENPVVRSYFNNHHGAKAVINALEFKDMLGISVSNREKNALEFAKSYYSRTTLDDIIKDP